MQMVPVLSPHTAPIEKNDCVMVSQEVRPRCSLAQFFLNRVILEKRVDICKMAASEMSAPYSTFIHDHNLC